MKLIILSHPHQGGVRSHKVAPLMVVPCLSSIVIQYQGFVPSVLRATFQSYSSLLRLI